MFPACGHGVSAGSAVTSAYVTHKHIERAHPAWKSIQVFLKNKFENPYSSFYFQRLGKEARISLQYLCFFREILMKEGASEARYFTSKHSQ